MRHLQNIGLFCDSPWMTVPQHDRRAKFVHLCPLDPTFPVCEHSDVPHDWWYCTNCRPITNQRNVARQESQTKGSHDK